MPRNKCKFYSSSKCNVIFFMIRKQSKLCTQTSAIIYWSPSYFRPSTFISTRMEPETPHLKILPHSTETDVWRQEGTQNPGTNCTRAMPARCESIHGPRGMKYKGEGCSVPLGESTLSRHSITAHLITLTDVSLLSCEGIFQVEQTSLRFKRCIVFPTDIIIAFE